MEWIEITGKSVEEAKEAALDQLGVDADDAEFEVLAEAKAGLFGLMRSEARVRARVAPTSARPKVEHRRRSTNRRPDRPSATPGSAPDPAAAASPRPRRSAGSSAKSSEAPAEPEDRPKRATQDGAAQPAAQPAGQPRRSGNGRSRSTNPAAGANEKGGPAMGGTEDNEAAVEVAKEFLAGVASRFSDRFEVTSHEMTDDDVVEIAVTGDDLSLLIGPRGQTLTALQELTRTVVQRRVPLSRTRLMVDVAGYREARREALARFANQVADQVKSSGEPQELEPMSAADRKVVHDTINGIDGVSTTSEGEDTDRHVVVLPA